MNAVYLQISFATKPSRSPMLWGRFIGDRDVGSHYFAHGAKYSFSSRLGITSALYLTYFLMELSPWSCLCSRCLSAF
jgi:hypothetical protein